jgi:hypothetical protein
MRDWIVEQSGRGARILGVCSRLMNYPDWSAAASAAIPVQSFAASDTGRLRSPPRTQ